MIMNEKIKASEVRLTGVDGEDLGIVPTAEALSLARQQKVDLVCTSLMSSPPLCRLMGAGAAKQEAQQARNRENRQSRQPKVKEIRLTPAIEDHDYETKKNQAQRILKEGDAVQLVVRVQGKEGAKAKALLDALLLELRPIGRGQTGIQLSGKQAAVLVLPLEAGERGSSKYVHE
jgi:translation initiation factor IF-3